MKQTLLIALLFILSFFRLTDSYAQARVIGYVSGYEVSSANLNSFNWQGLTDVYYGSINPAPDGRLITSKVGNPLFDFDMNAFTWMKNTLKTSYPDKKMWIVLGGTDIPGVRSARLESVCGNVAYRTMLINDLINFAGANNLDGIVIDWEFPTTASQTMAHHNFIAQLKDMINQWGLHVKIACVVGGEYKNIINHLLYIQKQTIDLVDYIDVLTFQFPQSYNPNDHATLEDAQNSLNTWAGNNVLGLSVPKQKLTMAIPFFGLDAFRSRYTAYSNEPNYVSAYNTGGASGLYYNSKTTIDNKVSWTMMNGFGGVVMYDLLQDRSGPFSLQDVVQQAIASHPIGATFLNPILIGNLKNTMNYTHQTSNAISNNYKNDYGNLSDDIFYQFTLTEPLKVSISLCNGGDANFDTYLYLLDNQKNVIIKNDDNGPLCTSRKSSIVRILNPGTYFIIVEGYNSSSGTYQLQVNWSSNITQPVGATFANPIKLGAISEPTTTLPLTIVNNNVSNSYGDDYTNTMAHGQNSDDVIYKFDLLNESRVTVSTCESDFDTYIHLIDTLKREIGYDDDYGPSCATNNRSSLVLGLLNGEMADVTKGKFKDFLPKGTYFIVVEGYADNSGNIQGSILVETKEFLKGQGLLRTSNLSETTNNFTISPNPASQQFTLTLPVEEDSEIQILDEAGKIVKSIKTSMVENFIDVHELDSGIYLVQIIQWNTIVRKKLSIVK